MKKRLAILQKAVAVVALAIPMFSLSARATEATAHEGAFRIAILHGTFGDPKNPAHHQEYDKLLEKLGWGAGTKYASTSKDMERLLGADGEIARYDMMLFCPLFGYMGKKDGKELPLGIDMRPYGKKIRSFIEKGGAVVIPDALYEGHYDWLTSVDPSLGIGMDKPCRASRDVSNTLPESSFRFLPNLIREDNSWGHLTVPKGHGWHIITTCGCGTGNPGAVVKRIGKGYVYVCAQRILGEEWLENLRANLELMRMGLTVTRFDLPEISIGPGHIDISLKAFSGASSEWKGLVTITPLEGQGKERTFSKAISLQEGKESVVEVPYEVTCRGKINVYLQISDGKQHAMILNRKSDIPPLLRIQGPRYRGFAVQSDLRKNDGRILCVADVVPHRENLPDLSLRMKVIGADGEVVGSETFVPSVTNRHFLVPIQLGFPRPGTNSVIGELMLGEKMLARDSAEVIVLSDEDCPVYINDDMNFVVHGKEFFPLGIYHVHPTDVAAVAELGFNTVQMFSWFFEKAFTVPAEHDMMVLYEQNFRQGLEEWIGQAGGTLAKKHPNVLMWYGIDEPIQSTHEVAEKLCKLYHKYDTHPVFVPSYAKSLYPTQTSLADVLAPDTYPYSDMERPISVISDYVDAMWAATKGDKPVMYVPQCFGNEPAAVLRNMAYQGIIHEVRGLIWYPWFDDPGNGLKNNSHPEYRQQETMKQLLHEFKTLTPALLNKEGRRQFKSEDGMIHGLFCQEKKYGKRGFFGRLFCLGDDNRYMLLVNPYKKPCSIDLSKVEGLAGAEELKAVFEDETIPADGILTLDDYETRAFLVR